jgi:hypothetical protein
MQVDPRAWKRALLVWLATLLMFVFPLPVTADYWRALFQQPLFLVIAPIVLAGLSLLFPVKDGLDADEARFGDSYRPERSRSGTWTGIVCSVILMLFVGCVLLLANADTSRPSAEFTHRLNIVCGMALAILTGLTIYFAMDFKQPR